MKKAVIEVGTNSARLLIAEINDTKIKILKKDLITCRLGEGIDDDNQLNKDAMRRGLDAISEFKNEINSFDVNKIKIIGTSVLRDVNNSETFVKEVYTLLDLDLEIISGSKEAELIFKGVNFDLNLNNYMIIDIGGGSTEFIWKLRKDDEVIMKSIDLGAVRLSNMFIEDKETPIGKSIIDNISVFINKQLSNELDELPRINNLIGVGGTITSLASIMLKLDQYDPDSIHNYILKYSDVNNILHILRKLELKRRKKVKGLNPDRADIIIPGMVILLEIMKYLRSLKLRVSDYDILYGLLTEVI